MKRKFVIILLGICILLTSCKGGKSVYKRNGYTSIVTYDFNGGIMTNSVTDIDNSIKYAFEPDSYICDPTTLPNFSIRKEGFNFVGWYKDKDFTNIWDFEKDKINEEPIVLYAKWETVINYTYTLAYWDEATAKENTIYSYKVNEGSKFDDLLNKAKDRDGYTPIGYYQDKECTKKWDTSYTHPGGESDLDIKVYVKYISGEYTLVSTYNELLSASGNIYLTNDIDCGGKVLSFRDFNKTLNGNGFKISNFKVEPRNVARLKYSIFGTLSDGAVIKDVTFDTAVIQGPSGKKTELRIAGLAGVANGTVTIQNVTVCNSKVVIPENFVIAEDMMTIVLEDAIYDASNATVNIENFTSDYIIEDKR